MRSAHLAYAFAFSAFPATALCEVVLLQAVADNTLYQTDFGELSNGMGESMFAGLTMAAGLRRAVIRFDVSALPPDAIVQSVALTLQLTRAASAGDLVTIHRATASWGEGASIALGEGGLGTASEPGDATWVHRFYDTQTWTSAGGDFDATPLASTFVGALGTYQWSNPALSADVQSWIGSPASNMGWFILSDETTTQSAKRFATREHSNASFRPTLTITYIPTPCAAMLFLGGAMHAIRRRRDKKTANFDVKSTRIGLCRSCRPW